MLPVNFKPIEYKNNLLIFSLMRSIISYSIYGEEKSYQDGAIDNAFFVNQFFSGWQANFYITDNYDHVGIDVERSLIRLGAVCIRMKQNVNGMFYSGDSY